MTGIPRDTTIRVLAPAGRPAGPRGRRFAEAAVTHAPPGAEAALHARRGGLPCRTEAVARQ